MKHTAQDILNYVEDNDVKFVRLAFCDIFGNQKNISVFAGDLPYAFEQGVCFDGSSIAGFMNTEESDLVLWPDPDTMTILPWRPTEGRVMRMYCDITLPNGRPFAGNSRGYLQSVVKRAKAMGLRPQHSHHESGFGQNEVDFMYSTALKSADNLNTFKSTVKAIADRNGLFASFMPKPMQDQAGSGMHVNVSIHRDGKNLFQGDIAPDSEAGHFIAGILAHARELTCFCNPIPNSYTRFGSCEAPKYVSWSRQNRSQLVRLPSATGEFCRLELRSPDPSCNPYLVIGLILAAGLDGIEKKMPLPAPVNRNLFHKSAAEGLESLPESLREAITIAAQSDFIAKELPVPLMNKYFEYQTQLCHGYESAPDPQAWERENCFLKI